MRGNVYSGVCAGVSVKRIEEFSNVRSKRKVMDIDIRLQTEKFGSYSI